MERSKLAKEFEKGLKHFYDCIDFGKCNLDAEAIQFMNEMPGRLVNSHDSLIALIWKLKPKHRHDHDYFYNDCTLCGIERICCEKIEVAIAQAEKQA